MSPNIGYQSNQQEREEESIDDLLEAMRMLSHSEPFQEDTCIKFGNYVARVLHQMSIVRGEAFVMELMNKITKVLMDVRNTLEISEQPQMSTSASSVIQKTSEQAGIPDEDTL